MISRLLKDEENSLAPSVRATVRSRLKETIAGEAHNLFLAPIIGVTVCIIRRC